MSLLKAIFEKLVTTNSKPEVQKSEGSQTKVSHESGGSSCCGGCGGSSNNDQSKKSETR